MGVTAFLLTCAIAGATYLRNDTYFGDVYYDDSYGFDLDNAGGLGLGGGDLVGAALYTVSYFFTTPVQVLLIFLGKAVQVDIRLTLG